MIKMTWSDNDFINDMLHDIDSMHDMINFNDMDNDNCVIIDQ